MSEKQTEAQRLADWIESAATVADMGRKPEKRDKKRQAADELRRLDAENQALNDALKYSKSCHQEMSSLAIRQRARLDELEQTKAVPGALPEIVERVLQSAGKTRRETHNPCITANECIKLANWIVANTNPQPAQQPLTDEQIDAMWQQSCREHFSGLQREIHLARAIEHAHGIK